MQPEQIGIPLGKFHCHRKFAIPLKADEAPGVADLLKQILYYRKDPPFLWNAFPVEFHSVDPKFGIAQTGLSLPVGILDFRSILVENYFFT